jgi:glycosyltransferase involved in cell wall biosynthesis
MKNNDIRILYLRSMLDAYGVTKIIFQLADELKNKGYTVIFASDNRDRFKAQIENMGFRHYTIPLSPDKKNILNFLICFIKIALIVGKERISIIHSHHRWSSFIAFFVSKIFRVPLITTYHGIHEGKKRLTLWGDSIISVSEDAKKHLVEYFHVNPEKIKVIHNGVQIPNFENFEIERKGNPVSNHPVIANIARMSPEKDQETLFIAMKRVIKNYPEVKLLLVGKGNLEDKLRMLVEQLGITKSVEFVGEIQDISSVLERIDFLVLSSLTEGLPMAVLEALAFEKPVVATIVGDIPSVVVDGETGCLVPPKNPGQLANAISFLLKNRDKALEMGRNGRELVKDKFSAERMAVETEKVYRDLLLNSKILDKESI